MGQMDLAAGDTVMIVYAPTCTKRNLLGCDEVFEVHANAQGWKVLLSMAADADGPWDRWTLLLGGTVVVGDCLHAHVRQAQPPRLRLGFRGARYISSLEGPSFHGSGCGRAMGWMDLAAGGIGAFGSWCSPRQRLRRA